MAVLARRGIKVGTIYDGEADHHRDADHLVSDYSPGTYGPLYNY